MNFRNETLHPDAAELYAILIKGADNYEALKVWKETQGLNDEQAADLYAFIHEAFEDRPVDTLSHAFAVSIVSKALWQHEGTPA